MHRTLTALLLTAAAGAAAAQSLNPVYIRSWKDCRTDNNQFVGGDGIFYWDVDRNCDIYQQDRYERPMTQTFYSTVGRYGAVEYFEYLDITNVRAGFDSTYLYVEIDLAGRDHLTSDGTVIPMGMVERYGFRISTNRDGRNGILVVTDQPELKNGFTFGSTGTFIYRDTDADVGGAADSGPTGLTVTKTDNPDEEDGLNGYDEVVASDGTLSDGPTVLWSRVSPTDNTKVELALNYGALGFTSNNLQRLRYFHVEAIKGGPKDPQNYLWNDKYTNVEAGSPNPGSGGLSEFGTNGLQNIYEVDTAKAGAIKALATDGGGRNLQDVIDLTSAIADGDLSADLNGDKLVNSADLLQFLAEAGN